MLESPRRLWVAVSAARPPESFVPGPVSCGCRWSPRTAAPTWGTPSPPRTMPSRSPISVPPPGCPAVQMATAAARRRRRCRFGHQQPGRRHRQRRPAHPRPAQRQLDRLADPQRERRTRVGFTDADGGRRTEAGFDVAAAPEAFTVVVVAVTLVAGVWPGWAAPVVVSEPRGVVGFMTNVVALSLNDGAGRAGRARRSADRYPAWGGAGRRPPRRSAAPRPGGFARSHSLRRRIGAMRFPTRTLGGGDKPGRSRPLGCPAGRGRASSATTVAGCSTSAAIAAAGAAGRR